MLGYAKDLEFLKRYMLSFNASKEVIINAPHVWATVWHTTYNMQDATWKEAIVNALHMWHTMYNM
jgi:hypothetical protein